MQKAEPLSLGHLGHIVAGCLKEVNTIVIAIGSYGIFGFEILFENLKMKWIKEYTGE